MAGSSDNKVRCDGGGGPLGHPAVYLTYGKDGRVACPYCGAGFVRSTESDKAAGGH